MLGFSIVVGKSITFNRYELYSERRIVRAEVSRLDIILFTSENVDLLI